MRRSKFGTTISLDSGGKARQAGGVGKAIEYDVAAGWIRREAGLRVANERRYLHIKVLSGILVRENAIVRRLTLLLVELAAVERRNPVHCESRSLPGNIGDLEFADRGAAEERNAAGLAEDVRHIPECPVLLGAVVNRAARRQRVFDAEIVLQITARGEVIYVAA